MERTNGWGELKGNNIESQGITFTGSVPAGPSSPSPVPMGTAVQI